MNFDENRRIALEELKEFKKSIPSKKSLLGRNINADTSRLSEISR